MLRTQGAPCLSGSVAKRANPDRTFDLVLKVKCHASENEDPVVLWKFPEDFGDQENDLNETLRSLYNHPVPKANTPVNLSVNQEIFIACEQVLKDQPALVPHSYFIAPDVTGLPTIPESRNLTEYFVAVDVNNMLQLYASMLHERRIMIISSKLSTVLFVVKNDNFLPDAVAHACNPSTLGG
nr:DENN domain-containing protein 1B-like isoform X5 [Pan troglodytes]